MTEREGTASRCARGGLEWISGKMLFMEGVVRHWKKLPRDVVKSLLLEVFKKCVNVVPGSGGLCSPGLMVELDF